MRCLHFTNNSFYLTKLCFHFGELAILPFIKCKISFLIVNLMLFIIQHIPSHRYSIIYIIFSFTVNSTSKQLKQNALFLNEFVTIVFFWMIFCSLNVITFDFTVYLVSVNYSSRFFNRQTDFHFCMASYHFGFTVHFK